MLTVMDFDRLLSANAVDFVQPSPAKMGGVTELCKVFPLAAVHNVPSSAQLLRRSWSAGSHTGDRRPRNG